MAIEVAPRKEEKPLWQALLFYFSFILLGLSLAGFLALEAYFIPHLDKQVRDMDAEINKQSQTMFNGRTIGSIEDEVRAAETKIKDFQDIYQTSPKATKFFQYFQDSVHPKVYFTNLSLNLGGEPKAALAGQTESFQSLIQQIEILQTKTNFIKNFDVSNIAMAEEGGVGFSLILNLQPAMFNK